MIGQTIGNYRMEALLGTGGMGQVYRAVHVHLGRPAAVKVLHANLACDPAFRARFMQEARAAAALDHPNIIQIYDFGEQGEHLYLVMELVSGGSARGLATTAPDTAAAVRLPLSLNVALQAAVGLAYAHGKGMVHRDIKPDNLLLEPISSFTPGQPNYVVKISDFGLARLADDGVKTSAGVVLGTPAYMSPEQVKGEALDGRSDIYSLGIVLYELVVSRRPFEANTLSQAVYQHLFTPPPPPRTLMPELPPLVEEIVLRCLAKQPQDRYDNAMSLVADLHRALARGAPASAAVPTPPAASVEPRPPPVIEPPPPPAAERPTTIADVQAPDATGPATQVSPLTGDGRPTQILAPASRPAPLDLLVLDEHGRAVQSLSLRGLALKVGRSPDNDIVLDHPAVSRGHCELRREQSRVFVIDLGSSNGTFLAGTRLQAGQPAEWHPRQDLEVGPFTLRRPATASATVAEAAVPRERPTAGQNAFVVAPRRRYDIKVIPATILAGQQVAVHIDNQGDVAEPFAITPEDPSGLVRFDPPEARLQVLPGTRQVAAFRARSARRRLLVRKRAEVSIQVRAESGTTVSRQVMVIAEPLLRPHWIALLLLLCLLGVGAALIAANPAWRELPGVRSLIAWVAPATALPSATATPAAAPMAAPAGAATAAASTATAVPTLDALALAATATAQWLLLDSDGDGLDNQTELRLHTNPWQRDSDGDGLGDREDPDPLVAAATPTARPVPTQPPAATATPRPPSTEVPTPTSLPLCTVTDPSLNMRSGPGAAYDPPITTLQQGATLRPLAFAASGFPSGAWLFVEVVASGARGWVSRSYVDCGALDVTRLPPGQIPPTPTLRPTAPPAPGPYDFRADRTQINQGECVYLRWNVQGVRAVYFDNAGVAGAAVKWVCPTASTPYTLRVVRSDGSQVEQTITIAVAGQAPAYTINVAADQQSLPRGGCTTLRWNIQGVRAVYLNNSGVAGVNTMYVCPQGTTTYTWRIVLPNGSETTRQVTIAMSP